MPTSSFLHGKGLTRTTRGDRQDGGSAWWLRLNELAVGSSRRGGLGPHAYTHALFADFDLAAQK
jgi:hypothetical protein